MYEYRAFVTKVYDGDTITVDIDLGFDVVLHDQKIRLYGINTPEIRTRDDEEKKRGYEAKQALCMLILDKWVTIHTHQDKKGKFGRWLGEIIVTSSTDEPPINVNRWLVESGHAKTYMV
jgi:micrococcal nuclease